MSVYLIKLMLRQLLSRFFGFLILICFCDFSTGRVLLPLPLLLLLIWLVVPFLFDLFGAIALLIFSSLCFGFALMFALHQITVILHSNHVLRVSTNISRSFSPPNWLFSFLSLHWALIAVFWCWVACSFFTHDRLQMKHSIRLNTRASMHARTQKLHTWLLGAPMSHTKLASTKNVINQWNDAWIY